jgi:3-hydroxymyristoyl/3-hydroxydecanoyl-(acyl carrier protein) dehydratase
VGADAQFGALTIAGGEARATVRPAHARHLCEGHFPADPILPGAYLAGLMADLGARLLAAAGHQADLAALERCVFLARAEPDSEIVVRARLTTDLRVEAEVRAGGACAARAVLRYREHR